jgi:hypothetical protein
MYKNSHPSLAICFAMIASAAVAAAAPARDAVAVETTDLQSFTKIAYVPVGADLSSIRFESVKAVKVATKRTLTSDCAEGYQEPGGSAYCPSSKDESPVPAYQVTYSFSGPPLASDEYGNTRFTFSVYVRPDDLSPAVRQAISAHKISRADTAGFFKLATSRGLVKQVSIDEQNSTLCAATYVDGLWARTNANCEDKVVYKTVAVPSGYITVRVDPASPQFERAVTAE